MNKIAHDIWDGEGNKLRVIVTFYSGGIGMTIGGYGNKTVNGDAEIVYLDYFEKKLQVVIHNDHEDEDPMTVDLDGAHFVYSEDGK